MNTRLVNQAADRIRWAMTTHQTPAGIAVALEAAGMLQSPGAAAETERLRARVAELEGVVRSALITMGTAPESVKGTASSELHAAYDSLRTAVRPGTKNESMAALTEHLAPCLGPASPDCACDVPVPYDLTPQATRLFVSVDKLRRFFAPSTGAGA